MTKKESLFNKFKEALENGDYQNEILEPEGNIEISYDCSDGHNYFFELGYEVLTMPKYKSYSGTLYSEPYEQNIQECEWQFTGEGDVFIDGDKVCEISDIFVFSPENEEKLKDFFTVNDSELISYEHNQEIERMRPCSYWNLNESFVKRVLSEELNRKDVKDMIEKAINDVLSDTKFRKKVIAITADVLEDFMDNLWTRKPFWKSIIKRS